MEEKNKKQKGFLAGLERMGNLLPHPVYIFMILTVVIVIVSGLTGGFAFPHPGTGEQEVIKSLFGAKGLEWFLANLTNNFIKFRPLGIVLTVMLGIGIAEESGLIRTTLKTSINKANPRFVTMIVIFISLVGSIASSAIFVIIPPLAAIIFKAMGRHPLAGLAAGFGGVAAGLSANIIITSNDVTMAGITETAAKVMDPSFVTNPTINFYFFAVSTIILTIVGTIVNEKIVEPRLGVYDPSLAGENIKDEFDEKELTTVTDYEKKGLKYAGIALLICVVLFGITIVPSNGILRGEEGSVIRSPFINNITSILAVLFASVGIAYGIGAKTIHKADDIIKYMSKSISSFSSFIVMCFFAAQFIEAFSYTNLGMYISVVGAEFLQNSGLGGIPLIIIFAVLMAILDVFIGSASAKWVLLSPIFVPMFMKLGFTPFFTQAAYRIGDSITNAISPLEPFMPFIIVTAQKYDKRVGLGTVISMMMPIAMAYFAAWLIQLIIWYVFNIPLGPGAGIFM